MALSKKKNNESKNMHFSREDQKKILSSSSPFIVKEEERIIYLKHKDHKTLVHIKDQLEKYIEINSGFRKIYIQFDFS